jgi:hypothetical protein
MPMVVPRGTPRILKASSTTVDRGRLHSSNGQQNYVRGRVNHVAAETAQEAQDVVFGMFLVNLAPASVLFDSEVSYSFISAQFVAKHCIPVHSMSNRMLASSPGGNMKAMY